MATCEEGPQESVSDHMAFQKTKIACVLIVGALGQFCLTRSALLEGSLEEAYLALTPPGDKDSACSNVALV